MNVKPNNPTNTVNSAALLEGSSTSQPSSSDLFAAGSDINDLDDGVIMRLPWAPQEVPEMQKLLQSRSRTKVKFYVGAIVVLCLWGLSVPAIYYSLKRIDDYDWAIRICSLLGCVDAFSFIVVLGFGYYIKYREIEIQDRVLQNMKEHNISDPAQYVAMGGDDNSRVVS